MCQDKVFLDEDKKGVKKRKTIAVFEHQKLFVGEGEKNISQTQLDALWKLNEYHDFEYFKPIAKGVQFTQFVGVIQVDGLTIEILPKADKDGVGKEEENKWRDVLLKMLQKCGRLKADTAGAAHVRRQRLNLLEVYFELYLAELDGLIRRGLVKQYRRETKNVNALKGKLEFAGHIQKNLIHKERFYTTHQVYDTNHQLHQVLFAALEVVDQFTKGGRLADYCKRVELGFPTVEKIKVTEALLNGIKLNRKTEPYAYAFELARLILLHYSPDISAGKERMLALLFDMNVLWEEYVTVMLRKYVNQQQEGYFVKAQEGKPFWGYNRLKPDIVLQGPKEKVVIDTKWKRPLNQSASIEDLRQMFAYNKFWKAQKAMLLYPGDTIGNQFKNFKEEVPESDKVMCKVEFVHVLKDGKLNEEIGQEVFEMVS